MKNFWLSWYGTAGPFTLEWPWWISGHRIVADRLAFDEWCEEPTICAAIQAADETSAKAIVLASHDALPADLEWRFCEEQPEGWEPFNSRFPKADWMQWPEPR